MGGDSDASRKEKEREDYGKSDVASEVEKAEVAHEENQVRGKAVARKPTSPENVLRPTTTCCSRHYRHKRLTLASLEK